VDGFPLVDWIRSAGKVSCGVVDDDRADD
jgi:hypothetical protein